MPRCMICKKFHLSRRSLSDGLCPSCKEFTEMQHSREMRISSLDRQIEDLEMRLSNKSSLYEEELEKAKSAAVIEAEHLADKLKDEISHLTEMHASKYDALQDLSDKYKRLESKLGTDERRLGKIQGMYRSILYAKDHPVEAEVLYTEDDLSSIAPAPVQALNIKELRKRYKKNEKDIAALLEQYKGRYTTKTNAAIYKLMVLALESELQNILAKLGYGKLESSLDAVKALTSRYYRIASDGNQTIAPTLSKFIGQLEYFYLEAVKVEYEYYVQRERAREEQRALKEQMRQEAEERKILEQQKKQVEAEEAKYARELDRISAQMQQSSDSEEVAMLKAQLEKVRQQLDSVQNKKDEIVRLQNGKAGTVYVISNIGSFGEDVFKVGMTRRLEPMDRVRELGDASVPFPFDVHSFIFSEDAVGLEAKLHSALNNSRVNKINLRKEFFRVSLDDLQALVEDCDPSAAFNRTALAEQFRQSLSIDVVPDSVDMSALSDDDPDDD